MNTIAKLGLAAVLLIGGATAAIAAQHAATGASTTTDTTTTGSVSANYGSVISGLQTGAMPDMTALSAATTVNCVGVSTLQGDATANAEALDTALTTNEANVTRLRTDIQADTALMTKLQTSCSGVANFDVNKIISVETGADGAFTVYVDDRAS